MGGGVSKPPNSGTMLTKAGSFTTDGTDGKLSYTTIAGDLSVAGEWKASASIVMTGWTGQTTQHGFYVTESLS